MYITAGWSLYTHDNVHVINLFSFIIFAYSARVAQILFIIILIIRKNNNYDIRSTAVYCYSRKPHDARRDRSLGEHRT